MKLMKSLTAVVAMMAALGAWAGGGITDTYKAKLSVTATPSGEGFVYASTDEKDISAIAESEWEESKTSGEQEVDSSSTMMTFWAYAKAAAGKKFLKWNDDNKNAKRSISTTGDTNTKTVSLTATFGDADKYKATFLLPVNGSYTVDSAALAEETTAEYCETVGIALEAKPAEGYGFLGWYTLEEGQEPVYFSGKASMTLPMPAKDVKVGASFYDKTMTIPAVASVAEINAWPADVVRLDGDLDAGGAALTIPAGKRLLLNARLTNVDITYFDNIDFGEAAYLEPKDAQAKLSNKKVAYTDINKAITDWTGGATLTLLKDVTVTSTVKRDVYSSTSGYVLDLVTFRWTAKECHAFQFTARGTETMASSYPKLEVLAKGEGGITVDSDKYAFYPKDNEDETKAVGKNLRQNIRVTGGHYKGGFCKTDGNNNAFNTSNFHFQNNGADGPLVVDGNSDTHRAYVWFIGGTYNGTFKNYVNGGTQYYVMDGGKFKSMPTCANDMSKTTTYVQFNGRSLSYDGSWYYVSTTPIANWAVKVKHDANSLKAMTGWNNAINSVRYTHGWYYYASVDTAMSKHSSGELVYGKNVTSAANRSVSSATLTIDASAEGAAYTGDVTLKDQNAQFVIRVAAGKEYKGTVTPPSGKTLHVVRTEADNVVTYTYSSSAPTADTAEVCVNGTAYFDTIYDAFYKYDGTKGNTIKLLKDIGDGVLITNGRAVGDGSTQITVDLNGKRFQLGGISASNGAKYELTIVDTAGGGVVVNTQNDFYTLGYKAYMQGLVDDRASYNLVVRGGTWQFDPTAYNVGGNIYGFVPDDCSVKNNGNGTWTVSEITTVNVTIPEVAGMKLVVTVGGVPVVGVNGVYAVDPGSRVVATYTVKDGYCGTGIVKEIAAAAEGDAVSLTEDEKAKPVVAKIGDVGYPSVSAAFAAADAEQTVALSADTTEAVAIVGKNAALDFAGHALTGSIALDSSTVVLCNSGATGGFVAAGEVAAAMTAANGSALAIESGSYQATLPLFACTASTVVIEDGTFAIPTDEGYVFGTVAGENAAIAIEGGLFSSKAFGAFLDDGHQPAEVEGGWTVGVKVVTDNQGSGSSENTAAVLEKASESNVDEESLAEVVAEDVKVVVNDETVAVAEKIVQETKVEGVKLTASEKTAQSVSGTKTTGIQAVVDAAKAQAVATAADNGRSQSEQDAAKAFGEAIRDAKNIEVKVEVKVEPKVYETPSEEVRGQVVFDLTPEARVTVKTTETVQEVETVVEHTETVPVTNDMIDPDQKIEVTLFTGFKPKTIVHADDAGNVIEVFKEDDIAYDAAKGTATVQISHFSRMMAFEEDYVAQIAEDPSRKYTSIAGAIAALGANEHIELLADASTLELPAGWRVFSYLGKTLLVQVPTPVVTVLTDEEVAALKDFMIVEFTDDVDKPGYVCDLPTAFCYKFEAKDAATEFDDWYVDYTVSFDRDIARNSMGLTGNYVVPEESAFYLKGDLQLGFFAKDAVPAGTKVPLLNYMTKNNNWTYSQIRTIVSSFKCGAFNLSTDNVGAKMTVELRLFAPSMKPSDIRDSSKWIEGVNTFAVHTEVEELKAAKVLSIPALAPTQISTREWPELVYAGTADKQTPIPAGAYYLVGSTFTQAGEPVEVTQPTAYFGPKAVEVISADGAVTNGYETLAAALAKVSTNETIRLCADNAENLMVDKAFAFSIVKGSHKLGGTVVSVSPLYDFEVAKDKGSCQYKRFDAVCEIGATPYSSLEKAFRLASDGDTVRMIANVTNKTTVVVDKRLVLDLNGRNVMKWPEAKPVYAGEAFLIDDADADLTITDLSGQEPVGRIDGTTYAACVYDGLFCVSNGNVQALDVGVWQEGGAVEVVDGTVFGKTNGVVMLGGALSVAGGVVKAGEGGGAGIFVNDYKYENTSWYYRPSWYDARCSVSISGGEIGAYVGNALCVYYYYDREVEDGIVTITGGKFKGGNTYAIYARPEDSDCIRASAGLYSTKPFETYVAYGYGARANTDATTLAEGYAWVVTNVPPIARIVVDEATTNDYWTLERAVAEVAEGQTIEILADNHESFDVTRKVAFSMKRNEYALTGLVKPHTNVSDDWRFEVDAENGVCSYCANTNVVKVLTSGGETEFGTFAEAVAHVNTLGSYATIRLMRDAAFSGDLAINRSGVKINLYGKTLTMAEGATLTVNGNNVHIASLDKNNSCVSGTGCIRGANGSGALIVTGSDVMAESVDSTVRIEVSGLYGNIAIKSSKIVADDALTAKDGAVILAYAGTYQAQTDGAKVIRIPENATTAHVIVKGGNYTGALQADNGFLDVRAGSYVKWSAGAGNDGEVVITGGTYDADPSAYVEEHYCVETNSPSAGKYTVKCQYECRMVGEDGTTICWTTLSNAVDQIRAGATAAIVLTKPASEVELPADCRITVDSEGNQYVTIWTYVFKQDLKDASGKTTNTVTRYCQTMEQVVKNIEDEAKRTKSRGTSPSITLPTYPTYVPDGYKVIRNGDNYVVTHKIYTCQVIDADGKTVGKYETIEEARAALGEDGGVEIVPPDSEEGEPDYEFEDPTLWQDDSKWHYLDDDGWDDDPTAALKQRRLTKEGFVVTRIRNSDGTYTFKAEIYIAQIGEGADHVYTTFADAIYAKTNELADTEYADFPIVVPNYTNTMVAPLDWKFERHQTGDSVAFHLVAKVYVVSIVGKGGEKYESFVEAIDALSAGDAQGELMVLNYSSTTMSAPSGWRFKQEGGSWFLSEYVTTGSHDVDVRVKASGSRVSREDIARVVKDVFIAEQFQTMTEVLGVKLTRLDVTNAVGQIVTTSGVQQVVSAAKIAGDAAFKATLEESTNVTIQVNVSVSPIRYAPASSSQNTGVLAFSLSPTATVVATSMSGVASNRVEVTNEMIDTNQLITVEFYTGFKPLQVVHRNNDGSLVKEYLGSEIEYDETTGVSKVRIRHFSTLSAMQVVTYAARIGSASYVTLGEAVKAVKAGGTIVLLADSDETITTDKTFAFTINKNSHTYTGAITAGDGYRLVEDGSVYRYSPIQYVAQNLQTAKRYETLAEALAGAADNATNTIKLLVNCSLAGDVSSAKSFVLNLNGKTLACGTHRLVLSGLSVTFADSSSGNTGTITGSAAGGSVEYECQDGAFAIAGGNYDVGIGIKALSSLSEIGDGRFSVGIYDTSTAPVGVVCGGVFTEEAAAATPRTLMAEGLGFVPNADPVTAEAYPWTIGTVYAVTFRLGDGAPEGVVLPADMVYYDCETAWPLAKPTYVSDAKAFGGWKFGESAMIANEIPALMIENLTLTATWVDATSVKVKADNDSNESTLEIKVTQEWIDENVKTEQTPENIQTELNNPDLNGNLKWQNYVLGFGPTDEVTGVAEQTDDEKTVKVVANVAVPPTDTGFIVKYSLDQVQTNGTVIAEGQATTSDEIDIDLDGVESNAFFKVNVIITKDDGEGDETKIAATNTLGVLKVNKAPATSIVAVPWNDVGGGDVTVANLVKTANLTKGDKLYVYKSDGTYSTWKLKEDGTWKSLDEGGGSPEAERVTRGGGAWLSRQDTTQPIVLFGQADGGAAETSLDEKKSDTAPSWNIVAAPSVDALDLNVKFNKDTKPTVDKDQVIVPTDGAPKNYTFSDGRWGYTEAIPVTNKMGVVRVKSVRITTDTKVPAGTGFWYLNSGDKTTVNW